MELPSQGTFLDAHITDLVEHRSVVVSVGSCTSAVSSFNDIGHMNNRIRVKAKWLLRCSSVTSSCLAILFSLYNMNSHRESL